MEQGTPTPLPVSGGVEGVTAGLGPDASWRWPEERWRRAVNKVRAGRPLRPATWPQGAQVAVALSFDVDQETLSLRDGKTSPALLAQGMQGGERRVAVVLPAVRRPRPETAVEAAGDDDAALERPPELRRKRETVLVVDRVLVLAKEHGAGYRAAAGLS